MGKTTQEITGRLDALRQRNAARDQRHRDVLAVREGDYTRIAGDFLPEDFDHAMVANLVDTAARDMSEVMAPLPSFTCATVSAQTQKAKDFAEKRSRILNGYVQRSRLQQQMFEGADRYMTFGFMALVVDPDFDEKSPCIRVDDASHAYYVRDYRGRVCEYYTVSMVPVSDLCYRFPDKAAQIEASFSVGQRREDIELVTYQDKYEKIAFLSDGGVELVRAKNLVDRCPVAIVQRPDITNSAHGQFDDVIWVQIARAMVQQYTMSALEQSVNAPLAVPDDVQELEFGPLSTIQSQNPQNIRRVDLNIPQGVWPATQMLSQEQRVGSRYPEGRSGSIDASIVTGQGVQALMGTFDTQIQTFQRLCVGALEDVSSMCFEMDEKVWPKVEKTVRVKDAGSPYEVTYTPAKDIRGDYTADVTYGAIAGLDPNRGLVFVLQALAAKLISVDTARRYLPVDVNASQEEEAIALEGIRESLVAAVAMLPQAIPMMATQGGDPREIVVQVSQVLDAIKKGKTPEEAIEKVFAPKEQPAAANPVEALTAPAAPGAPQSPGQALLAGIAGLTPGGDANLQANVMNRQPI